MEIYQHMRDADASVLPGNYFKMAYHNLVSSNFPIHQEYKTFVKDFYYKPRNVNWESRHEEEVSNIKATLGSSAGIWSAVNSSDANKDTQIFIANGGACNASVYYAFPDNQTTTADFYGSDQVKMMRQTRDLMYGKIPFLDATAVDIPYTKKLSLLVILPNKKDGLAVLEQKIKSFQLLPTLQNKLKMSSVDLSIPKFDFAFGYNPDLAKTIKKMRQINIFGDNADFSGLAGKPKDLKVSRIISGALLNMVEGIFDYDWAYKNDAITQKQNETLMAEAVEEERDRLFGGRTGAGPKVTFKADHPFMFIFHTNSVVFFIGRFNNHNSIYNNLAIRGE